VNKDLYIRYVAAVSLTLASYIFRTFNIQ